MGHGNADIGELTPDQGSTSRAGSGASFRRCLRSLAPIDCGSRFPRRRPVHVDTVTAVAANTVRLHCAYACPELGTGVPSRSGDLLDELRARRGVAVLHITHDLALAQRSCDEQPDNPQRSDLRQRTGPVAKWSSPLTAREPAP